MANEQELLLTKIFDISTQLYDAMSSKDGNIHNKIFEHLTNLGKTLVNADRASFWKWDKFNHTLWTMSATGLSSESGMNKIEIPDNTGLVGKALKEERVIVTNDPYNNPDFNSSVDKKTGYVTRSILVMPIANVNGDYIGAFQVINKLGDNGKFDEIEDCKRLSPAAIICGHALESDVFLDESRTDKLTGLRNRMGFFNDFHQKFNRILADDRTPLSLFICDIDKFKSVNDTYGHNIGDEVLKHVASILSLNCRSTDGGYRWGGEEFIMVMPRADRKACAATAESIRKIIEENDCEAIDGDKQYTVHHTMSFGVTEFDRSKSIEENISVADEKLYTAKESGRNRVIS